MPAKTTQTRTSSQPSKPVKTKSFVKKSTRKSRKRSQPLTADDNTAGTTTMTTTKTERTTATHIFFWGGVLSNWHTGSKFPGARCFELLLPELDKLEITYPSSKTFSSRLLQHHQFNCGEQWMMSMKAWFFETENDEISDEEFQRMMPLMYESKLSKRWSEDSIERRSWEKTACQILGEKNPRKQKALGRKVDGFDQEMWSKVNVACVTAACVARAEVDEQLKELYLSSGDRTIVEGSPYDKVWGVGLHWNSAEIDDPKLWGGENRLGICHDRAREAIKQLLGKN